MHKKYPINCNSIELGYRILWIIELFFSGILTKLDNILNCIAHDVCLRASVYLPICVN